MTNLRVLNEAEARSINGGKWYYCKICEYTVDTSWAKMYAHALVCVNRKYGRPVYSVVSRVCSVLGW